MAAELFTHIRFLRMGNSNCMLIFLRIVLLASIFYGTGPRVSISRQGARSIIQVSHMGSSLRMLFSSHFHMP